MSMLTRRLLLRGRGGGGGGRYLLNDQFSGDVAAGSVNGRFAVPGPGQRTVTDTESKLSIASNVLTFAGGKAAPGNGDPGIVYPQAIVRAAGRMLRFSFNYTTIGTQSFIGFNSATGSLSVGEYVKPAGTGLAIRDGGSATDRFVVGTLSTATAYACAIVLRAAGAYFFLKGGAFTNWILIGIGGAESTEFLYPGAFNYNAAFTADNIRVPEQLWLPTPLCYDTFTRADGALGVSEVSGPDGQVTPARTWTTTAGTVNIATTAAICAATGGGIGLTVTDSGTADVLQSALVTVGSATAGVVVRYKDADNYVYAIHNGTNAQLVKRVATSETTLVDAAAAYGAGRKLEIHCVGTAHRLYYNGAFIGTEQTVADADLLSGTKQGIYFTDTDSTLDVVQTFARGSGNEYGVLDTIV